MPVLTGESLTAKFFSRCSTRSATRGKRLKCLSYFAPVSSKEYDLDPDLARRSRLRMLDMIATERLAIAGAHVNAPGFGYLKRQGSSYLFEPA